MSKQQAVIIGGGVAGLAAALRLAEGDGYEALVLEREERPGGLARSLRFKGVSTDMGPHRIHTELPEVERLIESIAAPSLMTVQRKSHMYLNGHFLSYPPKPLAMARQLGLWQMMRFGMSFAWEKLRPKGGPESYESLMRGAFGQALYDYLLRPYSAKTWKIDPDQIHADTARVRVSAGSLAKMVGRLIRPERKGGETALKEFRYVRGGIETLVQHLVQQGEAQGVQMRLSTQVERLELDEACRVVAAECQGGGKVAGDVFLSTVPLPRLVTDMLPDSHPGLDLAEARSAASGLQYLDIIFVCLIVKRKVITGDNWLYFPEPHLIFNRGYEAKSFDPGMSPGERSVMCLEITHRQGDSLSRESDESLKKTVIEQIATTGLFGADEVEEAVVYRLPYAYPLYTLDYAERLDRIFSVLRRIPNLVTLGRQGLFNHNNMDHSIFMGLRAAACLNEAKSMEEASGRWYDEAGRFRLMRIVD